MGTSTWTGPLRAGTVVNTTGTTPGTLKNVGYAELAQLQAVTQIGTQTALATNIVVPANSTIVSIDLLVTTAWTSAGTTYTISVGTSATATELVGATAVNAIGRTVLTPGTDPVATANWINVGTKDVRIYVLSGLYNVTGGAGTLVVRYVQGINA